MRPSRREEPLRRRRGHVDAVGRQAHDRGVRRRVALGQRGAERGDIGARRQRRRQPRVRFTWYTSPAAMRLRGSSRRPPRTAHGRGSSPTRSRTGPTHGRPGHGRAGRTGRSGRTPARLEAAAPPPIAPASSAARSEVTSSRSVNSRPPTHGERAGARPSATAYDRRPVQLGSSSDRAGGVPQGRARLRRQPRSPPTPRPGTATTRSRSTRSWPWASSACSACPSPRSTAAAAADLTTLCVAIEELGRVDQSMAITLEAGVGLGANPIFTFGTEEQRQRWLPDLCAGRALGGFGLTEPEAAATPAARAREATLDDATGEWVIDGEKAFITNSGTPITSLVTVTAADRPGGRASPRSAPSSCRPARRVSTSSRRTARWAGTRPTPTASRSPAAGCPPTNLLGERGAGFAQLPRHARRRARRHRRARRRR